MRSREGVSEGQRANLEDRPCRDDPLSLRDGRSSISDPSRVADQDGVMALKRAVVELSAIGRNLNQIARAANQGGRTAAIGRDEVMAINSACGRGGREPEGARAPGSPHRSQQPCRAPPPAR
jgi:hypothetical protein